MRKLRATPSSTIDETAEEKDATPEMLQECDVQEFITDCWLTQALATRARNEASFLYGAFASFVHGEHEEAEEAAAGIVMVPPPPAPQGRWSRDDGVYGMRLPAGTRSIARRQLLRCEGIEEDPM